MSMIDRFLARFGYSKASPGQYPAWLRARADEGATWAPDYAIISNQEELYLRLSWVNIAVTFIAQAAASTALSVMRRVGEDTEDIPNHPFEVLLDRPNPSQSRFEFLESTFAYRALTGNAYWWLNRASASAPPDEIWVIEPNRLRPVPDGRLYLKGYVYDAGGREIALEPWEVVHFKRFHPLNPWIGLSPIEALAQVAEGDLGMQSWNTRLFRSNNGKLPGILAFADPIPDGDWEEIKRDTRDKSNKRELMLLRNVHAGGVQWIQAAATQRDMEFLAGRKMNKQEIFDTFAPGLFGMLSENATEANARTAKATFSEFCLWPLLEAGAQKVSNDVLPAYGESLLAEFDDPRVTDRTLELSEQQEYAKTHTVDEVRAKYYQDAPLAEVTGLPEDKRGLMLPAQIGPGTPLGDEPEPAEPAQPVPQQLVEFAQGQPEEPEEQPGELAGESEEETEPEDAAIQAELKAWERFALARLGKAGRREFACKAVPEAQAEAIRAELAGCETADEVRAVFGRAGQPAVKRSRDAREPGRAEKEQAEERLAAAVLAMFRAQRARAQERLAMKAGVQAWVQQIDLVENSQDIIDQIYAPVKAPIPDWVEEILEPDDGILANIRRPLLEAVRGGVALFGRTVPLAIDYDLVNIEAAEWARKYTFELIDQLNDTTLAALRKAIPAFAETPGMTVGEVMEMLPFSPERAARVATTEITRAYATANKLAGEQLAKEFPGIRVVKHWYTNNDDLVCDACGPLDGEEVGLEEAFRGGIDQPPAHTNCRCWMETSTAVRDE